jgi:hypothetical protein
MSEEQVAEVCAAVRQILAEPEMIGTRIEPRYQGEARAGW